MAAGHPGGAARQVRRLFEGDSSAGLTDGQLLERFATRRGEGAEAAFEALVNRHGPMVLRVCRSVLRDPHHVEDAFQATFLVLVRKAHAIDEREQLGPWLYGVARRVALKARSVAARRSKREGGREVDPPVDPVEGPWLDLRPVLHEELDRLPEKYRKPVILCHLQGLTHSEAASELAWPVGTVSVRLARARKLLKERLTRRGLASTAALWGADLAADVARVGVPDALVRSTTAAALKMTVGTSLAGAVSAGSAYLTKRTLAMMLVSRLKWMIIPVAIALGATGGGIATHQFLARLAEKTRAESIAAAEQAARVVLAEAAKATKALPIPSAAPEASDPGDPQLAPGGSPFAPMPLNHPAPRDPFVVEGGEAPTGMNPNEAAENRHALEEANRAEFPPGFFDLPPHNANDPNAPPLIKPGQVLTVEVLEALPGRPISGDRVVRPDGTISLGFYGDLQVAGLDRNQIKVKFINHLRDFITDEVLGLEVIDPQKNELVPREPVRSNRVFIDESTNFYPGNEAQASRPKVRGRNFSFEDQVDAGRLDVIEGKVQRAIREMKEVRERRKQAEPDAPKPGDANGEELAESDRLSIVEDELYAALKELDEIRGRRKPVTPAASGLGRPTMPPGPDPFGDPAAPPGTPTAVPTPSPVSPPAEGRPSGVLGKPPHVPSPPAPLPGSELPSSGGRPSV